GIGTGASTLQAYRDQANPVLGVAGQLRHELIRVALRIPLPRIRVGPLGNRVGVFVVEDGLRHAGIQEQALGRLSWRGQFSVDEKASALDCHDRVTRARSEEHTSELQSREN